MLCTSQNNELLNTNEALKKGFYLLDSWDPASSQTTTLDDAATYGITLIIAFFGDAVTIITSPFY